MLEEKLSLFPQFIKMHVKHLKNAPLRKSRHGQILNCELEVFTSLSHLSMNSNASRISCLARDDLATICIM
jgi:hypothetical protein